MHIESVDSGVGMHADTHGLQVSHGGHGPVEGRLPLGDQVVNCCCGAFQAHLGRIQAGVRQSLREAGIDAGAVCDEIDPHAQFFGISRQFRQLFVQRRLTAGEAHGRHLAFMPELVQHGTDLCHAHNFFIIHRLGGAVAARVAEDAAQVAFVGDGHLGKDGQVGKMAAEGFDFHAGVLRIRRDMAFEHTPYTVQKQGQLLQPGAVISQPPDDSRYLAAIKEKLENLRPLGIEFLRLVGAFDQDIVFGAHEDVGPDIADELVHPG